MSSTAFDSPSSVYVTNYTAAQALDILARTTLRDFTKDDWLGYSGCESEKPLIGEYNGTVVVVDGPCLLLIDGADEYGGQLFTLSQ
jgi:hypothetical protein